MATYVNDLRLKEIGTGESSGTWGTETNVNLELIGEALGYGTEGITTNANTHTTTVADGSTDPGRAMYIEYTGTLDSACTVTIAPNTLSRLHYIENGTSGSQNIIIKQGSGATVTIPPGDTKAVYLDGAGSGAKVVDVFASFSVVDLKVQDDLTVTDDATVGGTLGVTGILTCTDDIIIGDGKTIGSASDVDAMTIAANGQVTFTQTLIGTALDISGDIDVDGTANLDIVDIDGATNIAAAVTMATNNKIQFRDDAIHISSTADGQLDLVADTEIQIAATTIDINGAINASGEIIAASLDISGNIDVDGTTNLDVVDIDGAVDMASTLTLAGNADFNGDLDVDGTTNLDVVDIDGAVDMASTLTVGSHINLVNDKQVYWGDGSVSIQGDGANEELSIGVNNVSALTFYSSEAVFNEGSNNIDLRVESNGQTHAFYVDGGTNAIGIGTTPPTDSHTGWNQVFIGQKGSLISENATGTHGLDGMHITDNLYMDADTGSFANIETNESSVYQQEGGIHKFFSQASGSAGAAVTLAEQARITTDGIALSTNKYFGDSSDTDNYLQFNQANTFRFVTGDVTSLTSTASALVINEDGANLDTRIETDENANMFIVDAGGNDVRIGSATSYVSANLQVTQNNGTEKHLIALTSGADSTIVGSGQSAKYVEGVVACNTTSAGNTISIPITSQSNLWRQYQVELMVASAEYNSSSAQSKGGTATFGLTSLSSLNIGNVVVTGNISGVTVSGMNILVEFSSAFTSGLNNFEGCVMHYKVIGITPEYFEGWAATLD